MWNAARVQLRRLGCAAHYVLVAEPQGDGTCHLHVATDDDWVPWKDLDAIWTRLGGGYVWVSPEVKGPSDVGAYLSKYLTKYAGEDLPWEGRRRCLENGRTRRVPFRRYTSDRETGAVIAKLRAAPGQSETDEGEDPPWEAVRPWLPWDEGEELDWVPLRAPPSPVLDGCPSHLGRDLLDGLCCHEGGPCSCSPWDLGTPGRMTSRKRAPYWGGGYYQLASGFGHDPQAWGLGGRAIPRSEPRELVLACDGGTPREPWGVPWSRRHPYLFWTLVFLGVLLLAWEVAELVWSYVTEVLLGLVLGLSLCASCTRPLGQLARVKYLGRVFCWPCWTGTTGSSSWTSSASRKARRKRFSPPPNKPPGGP